MRAHPSERGSALLLSILATAVLGAGLMAVLGLSGAERRVVANQAAQTDAYAVAETGLQQFVANRIALGFTSSPAASYESTRVSVAGGHADVVLQLIRPAVGSAPPLYVIRSRGFSTAGQLSGTPLAERQVAQLASWSGGAMASLAAFTAINGLTKVGGAGALAGVDACGVSETVAGVAVGNPGYTQNGASVPTGSPAILSLGTQAQAAAAVPIDWAGVMNGTTLSPTIALPGGTFPAVFTSTDWPIIKVTGDYTLPNSGQGVLIVTGSLTVGAQSWNGVILIGDALIVTGSTSIQGAVVTGLNAKLGQAPPVSTINNGTRIFQYNSCHVASAMGGSSAGLTLIRNAWMDDWDGW
jgi:hypothetical protein